MQCARACELTLIDVSELEHTAGASASQAHARPPAPPSVPATPPCVRVTMQRGLSGRSRDVWGRTCADVASAACLVGWGDGYVSQGGAIEVPNDKLVPGQTYRWEEAATEGAILLVKRVFYSCKSGAVYKQKTWHTSRERIAHYGDDAARHHSPQGPARRCIAQNGLAAHGQSVRSAKLKLGSAANLRDCNLQ